MCIPAENFPFCTIEPNEARVIVPDERFEWLCQLFKPKSEVRGGPMRCKTSSAIVLRAHSCVPWPPLQLGKTISHLWTFGFEISHLRTLGSWWAEAPSTLSTAWVPLPFDSCFALCSSRSFPYLHPRGTGACILGGARHCGSGAGRQRGAGPGERVPLAHPRRRRHLPRPPYPRPLRQAAFQSVHCCLTCRCFSCHCACPPPSLLLPLDCDGAQVRLTTAM